MEPKTANRRKMVGLVVKDKMDKTVVVEVQKRYKHGMYQKYLTTKTRARHTMSRTRQESVIRC